MVTLVGKKAPKFSSPAIVDGKIVENNFSLEKFIGQKYVVLFFYTKDFSGICPSELHDFQSKIVFTFAVVNHSVRSACVKVFLLCLPNDKDANHAVVILAL